MKPKALSVAKFGETMNEDAVVARPGLLAVSDGAGGGGLFADEWSKYLMSMLPDNPLTSFGELDGWLDGIWESFYSTCEQKARIISPMHLSKFYNEGSFATLAAVWFTDSKVCRWMAYGDSVVFCYNRHSGLLQHSFTRLADFNRAPYLVSCKDPLNEKGFSSGQFDTDEECILFVTSDALAHYILMMYEVSRRDEYAVEIQEALNCHTKCSNYVQAALTLPHFDFGHTVVDKLLRCRTSFNLQAHLQSRYSHCLLALDDYSIAMR